MSVKQNLGKVSVTPQGAWNASTAYAILDVVTNGGGSYLAKKAVPAGTALNNTEYWLQIAEKGDKGDDGETYDDTAIKNRVSVVESKIPSQATAINKLADKDFVNSSISTNTANYISNNGQPFTSVAQLEAYSGTVTNNDYAFITGTDESGNAYFDRYKATVSGGTVSWAKEYRLNNSSFTAAQWAAISSGITSAKVAEIDNKVNKTNKVYKIYGTDANGNQFNYGQSSASTAPYTFPLRNANGQIVCADPTADNQAATKKYVDDKFVFVSEELAVGGASPEPITINVLPNTINATITLDSFIYGLAVRKVGDIICYYDGTNTKTKICKVTNVVDGQFGKDMTLELLFYGTKS